MERLRSCAALEQEVIRRESRPVQSAGGTIWVPLFSWAYSVIRHSVFVILFSPLFVFGHACEFLVAKLEVKPDRVILEITADYGGNPLIPDEATARDAVKNIFEVYLGGQVRRLEDLEPLRFEFRTQWDPETPASFAPPPNGQDHQLLTGIWNWPPHTDFITLAVPKKNLHDALLWTKDEKLPGKDARWMLLIEGDKTPEIRVTPEQPELEPHGLARALQWGLLGSLLTWMIYLENRNHRKGKAGS